EGAPSLRRDRASARGQPARGARRRFAQSQEQGCRVMATENTPETETQNAPATVSDLSELNTLAGSAVADAAESPVAAPSTPAVLREQEIDAQGRAYATGRRKDAVARVWLKPGSGKVVVNGREQEVYFARPSLRLVINQPFQVAGREGQYDVIATVKGGGLSGQAGAVKH